MRRVLIIVPLLAVLALGGWTVAWYVASQRLIDEIGRWAEARRAEGYQVNYQPPTVTGFPSRVAAQIMAPDLAAPVAARTGLGWAWRAPFVRVEIVPWRLDRIMLRNQGENRVTLIRDSVRHEAVLTVDAMAVRLEAGRREAGRYVIDLEAPTLTVDQPPVTAKATRLGFDLRLYRVAPGDHTASTADLAVGVTDLVTELFGKAVAAPLTTSLTASLLGGIPPGRLDQAVTAWRDDGGTIEVHRLLFSLGGVNAHASGTLALDNQMRPMGAATASIRGHDEAIDRLTAAGTINPRDATLAKLLLTALARPDGDGERILTVPITGQDGWLSVGPARLARLEALKLTPASPR